MKGHIDYIDFLVFSLFYLSFSTNGNDNKNKMTVQISCARGTYYT